MHSVSKDMRLSERTTKIWMKIDPYCQRRRCSPTNLDSAGNISFMRIFAWVPWRGSVKRQCGNQTRRFLTLYTSSAIRKWSQHYYIVTAPCRLSTDNKIHDLEWPFYVQFSIFTITNRVSAIMLHTYRWAVHRIFSVWPQASPDRDHLTSKHAEARSRP